MFCNQLNGQLSYGGEPYMNDQDFTASKVLYMLPPEDPLVLDGLKSIRQNSYAKALQYAVERPVDISPEFNGQWVEKDGISIWRAHLISPEAYSIGILFSAFRLAQNSSVFIYDPEGRNIKGAFNSRNNKKFSSFYVGHIPGEEVIVEIQTNNPDRDYGELRIGTLSHAFLPVYGNKSMEETGLGSAQDCEIDINCPEGVDWQVLKRSVCHISTTRLLCTGALVNNTSYDGTPYVLTAEHCVNRDLYAYSSVFYFNFENSECGIDDAAKEFSISGSELISTGGDIDFSLLKLTERPPREFSAYYAGWDAREMDHPMTITIHHPNADAKKISYDLNATSVAASVPGDLNDYIVSSNYWIKQWDLGTTEGGSSGCPQFNPSKRMIGVLSGGLAVCGDSIGYDVQNNRVIYSLDDNKNDYFSKLYYAWDHYEEADRQLKNWLDPGNTGLISIGGLNSMTLDKGDVIYKKSLQVFPNPSNGEFQVRLLEYGGGDITIELYDLTGHRVYTVAVTAGDVSRVSASHLPAGIYAILIKGNGTGLITGSIIIH
ncbi:MAG: T9SS type A sorting domain-containing protein [Bacteroidales bacterium]|nr:T9SS type A sorting domain-containing protein [Bacteroidales bacterium]